MVLPRKQVKAYFYGHTHIWGRTDISGIHLVNLPAMAWAFDPTQPRGFVTAATAARRRNDWYCTRSITTTPTMERRSIWRGGNRKKHQGRRRPKSTSSLTQPAAGNCGGGLVGLSVVVDCTTRIATFPTDINQQHCSLLLFVMLRRRCRPRPLLIFSIIFISLSMRRFISSNRFSIRGSRPGKG